MSAGESISAHLSPWMLSVHTWPCSAISSITDRYQACTASARRSVCPIASRKSADPVPRNTITPIDSAPTISGASRLPTLRSRPSASRLTFMSSAS